MRDGAQKTHNYAYNFLYPRGGREQVGPAHNQLAIDPAEREWGFFPATWLASMDQIPVLMAFGGLQPYVAALHTETKDNSATIGAMPDGFGLRFQAQASPSDDDDICISGINGRTPAAGKDWFGFCRLQMPDVANMGFTFGIAATGATELFSANPSDGVFFIKANDAAGLTLRVRGNGGTAADVTSFTTSAGAAAVELANDTDIVLGFHIRIGTSAATSVGEVWVNGYRTVFSSAQMAQLFAILTSPPVMIPQLGFRLNGTTQKRAVVAACCVGCWR